VVIGETLDGPATAIRISALAGPAVIGVTSVAARRMAQTRIMPSLIGAKASMCPLARRGKGLLTGRAGIGKGRPLIGAGLVYFHLGSERKAGVREG
jgi:hypothetical protein